MFRRFNALTVSPLAMCRICLRHAQNIVDVLGANEPHLIQHVREYFKVEISGGDNKSTKLCSNCIQKIQIWQGHIEKAENNQRVVNYLANKCMPIDPLVVDEQPLFVPNKGRKTTSRRFKKSKRTSSIPDVHEIPSTSNGTIQSPLESIQQSTSASIVQCQSIDTQYVSDVPSTSKSTSASMFQCQSIDTQYVSDVPSTSKSTSASMSQCQSIDTQYVSDVPSTSKSTSASMSQCQSIDTQYVSDVPSTSKSTSASMSQCQSIDTQYVSDVPSTSKSTSASMSQCQSIDTQYVSDVPSTSKSTSTEIIPIASTSAEVIPYASSSTMEIVPSYTVNEISSSGDNPVWYSNGNEKTDPESEVNDRYKSFKSECVCIFCTHQHKEVSRNAINHILFCSKHSKPYACLIENCHAVFPNKLVFIQHYRTHLKLNNSTYLCNKCFSVLTCPRMNHTHQNLSDLYRCCSLTFTTMTKFVLHKLINHCAIVVTSHNRSRTLLKQNLNIKKTELDDIKVGLDVPGTVPCNRIIKNNGSYKCYRCPKYFNNILKFIDHSKIKHKNLITLKDKGIKLCPLCDNSYFNEQYTEHLENCTNTMLVGEKSLCHYGCVYCLVIFTDVSSREFRNHVLYCKSFKLGIVNNKIIHKCMYCTFSSTDDNLSLVHANSNCMYFQLKMRYAMGPEEEIKVMQRMEFVQQNTEPQEDQEDKDRTNDAELLISSKTVCNTARQKLLKFYNFFCTNCENLFFDKNIFFKHMTETGSYCRLQNLVYCQKCLTDFNTMEEYEGHLPGMPDASPILLSVKEELHEQNNYEYSNLHMDVVPFSPKYCGMKVEMNNETFYQKQEPIDEGGTSYNISNMLEQEQAQELELEQEVSNDNFNDYAFSCPEIEFTTNDIYMHCEVEEKPDLNKMLTNPE